MQTRPVTDVTTPTDVPLSPEDRAAIRAYLQRSEVRLSTVHRVASALLSGAGLLVLLPAVERDAVEVVLRTLLTGPADAVHLLLVVAVATSLAVPFTALWLVLRDLTQFYFHANHIRHDTGDAFTPRFTLTGLRLPRDELGPRPPTVALDGDPGGSRGGQAAGAAQRRRPPAGRPPDGRLRARARPGRRPPTDTDRAAALFELAASTTRPLVDEVAKVEHGMARHVLSIQVIVLRYAKALLALLTSALAAFAAAGVVSASTPLDAGQEVWLAAIFLTWAPVAIVAVTSPVRWLERQLRSEGATRTAAARDPELTRVETVTVRLALGGFAAAAVAMVAVVAGEGIEPNARVVGAGVLGLALVGLAAALRAWTGRPPAPRAPDPAAHRGAAAVLGGEPSLLP